MSPEQARGEDTDVRADVWSFGVILWEMLTGTRLFKEPTVSDTLAAVLRADLDLDALPAETPWNIRRTLERCLERDPGSRYHSVADARIELLSKAPQFEAQDPGERRPRRPALLAAVAVALIAGTWLGGQFWPRAEPVARQLQLSIPINQIATSDQAIAITPDGRSLIYASSDPRQLYHRPLGQPHSIPIPGTEGGQHPVSSPDGQWVAFVADGALKKVQLSGGTPQTLLQFDSPRAGLEGATWSTDGTIYAAVIGTKQYGYSTLVAIPEQGGEMRVLIPMIDDAGMPYERANPQLLPGETHLLFNRLDGDAWSGFAASATMVLDLATGVETKILNQHGQARYLPSGHLLATSGDNSFSLMPFNAATQQVTGPSVPVQDLIATSGTGAHLEVALDGTIVFERATRAGKSNQLAWLGLDGRVEKIPVAARDYQEVSLSPDGARAALNVGEESGSLWIYDFGRDVLSAVTSHSGSANSPLWMSDSQSLVFACCGGDEGWGVSLLELESGESPRRLAETGTIWTVPWDVSPDGKTVAAFIWDPVSEDNWDTILIPTDGSSDPVPFSSEAASEYKPRFSPDGNWIAFVSDRTGNKEIYLK
jgi:serine/threonine-protein kinase